MPPDTPQHLAAFRALDAHKPFGESYTEADVREAAAVIRWHALNLSSFVRDATATLIARAANWAASRLKHWSDTHNGKVPLLSCLGNNAAGDGKFLKNDTNAKRQVIWLLVEYGYVVELARGSYEVNPLDPEEEAKSGETGLD